MVVWGRGTGSSSDLWTDQRSVAGALTSLQRRRQPPSGCTKTPESLYGINRNGCTRTLGIRTVEQICPAGTWTEVDERIAAPRLKMTDRAGRWATFEVGKNGRTVAEVAEHLGCD